MNGITARPSPKPKPAANARRLPSARTPQNERQVTAPRTTGIRRQSPAGARRGGGTVPAAAWRGRDERRGQAQSTQVHARAHVWITVAGA